MADRLQRAYDIVASHMAGINGLFHPGVKITVIVRRPGQPEQDFLVSSEDGLAGLDEVKLLIGRRQAAHG
jgi:hypothetical protein